MAVDPSSEAVRAATSGAPWWAVATIAFVSTLLGAMVRQWPNLRKLNNEREANLLSERAAEMDAMRKSIAKLEAERAVDRHRINNLTQCLDALLMMIELDPDKAKEAAARVKAMRADQIKAEAAEKGAVHAASILAED